jgi:hypothetical protein
MSSYTNVHKSQSGIRDHPDLLKSITIRPKNRGLYGLKVFYERFRILLCSQEPFGPIFRNEKPTL